MSRRVLLVEDGEDIIQLISDILRDDGNYSLIVATDGEAGLAAARAAQPDVILLDISLPKMSGWEVLPRLHEEGISAPVITLTAHAMKSDRETALALGSADYLSKPFEIDDLLAMLERHAPTR